MSWNCIATMMWSISPLDLDAQVVDVLQGDLDLARLLDGRALQRADLGARDVHCAARVSATCVVRLLPSRTSLPIASSPCGSCA